MSVKLICSQSTCRRPWLHVANGVVVVESRHGGHFHTNVIALIDLLALLDLSMKREQVFRALYDVSPIHNVRPALIALPVFAEPLTGIELVCHEGDCNRPWAYAIDGVLYVESHHDRERHVNSQTAEMFRQMFGPIYLERLEKRRETR